MIVNLQRLWRKVLLSKQISPSKRTDSVAQLVEHLTFNQGVLGSSPSRITKLSVRVGVCVGVDFLFHTHIQAHSHTCFGPIVQRIVCRFPEPKIQVRFLVGPLLKEYLL